MSISRKVKSREIRGHRLGACLGLWAKGHLSSKQVQGMLELNAAEIVQLKKAETRFGLLEKGSKDSWFGLVEPAATLLQEGLITEAKFDEILGF